MPDQVYTIVEPKEEIRKLDKAGNPVIFYRIWATTKKGSYYHVDVHESELAKSHDLLAQRARELDAI